MATQRRTQAERRATTRAAVLAAARDVFARDGFVDAQTSEIVERAGVSRGGLYHHFEDKAALFAAVCEQLEAEVTQRVAEEAAAALPDGALASIRAGVATYLDACTDPVVQQVLVTDGPAVLGLDAWRDLGDRYGAGLTRSALQGAIEAGAIRPLPLDALTRTVLGALHEAALYVGRAEDPPAAMAEATAIIEALLDGLRAEGSQQR